MKEVIEKPPFIFTYDYFSIKANVDYLNKYQAEDEKGRYLYWDKFKWRVDDTDNPEIAWWATKFARHRMYKSLNYADENGKAFVFCMPDSLLAKLYKVSQYSLAGLTPVDSIKQQYLISSLIIEEAISSSQLEGASTTRKVAKDMLLSSRKPRDEDETMIRNNYLLMKEVKRVKCDTLTVDMILEFHKIAVTDTTHNEVVPGQLRKSNDIVITDGIDTVIHQPPHYEKSPKRLKQICEFANTLHDGEEGSIFIHPIVKAIILHFIIGYDHPFSDGNGRTARAIFYWYMLKSGFDYFEYVSISKLLKNAPKQYTMSYIYSEHDDNDLTYFIYYQVDIILRAIDELLEYLQIKSKEFEEVTLLLQGSTMSNQLNHIQKEIIKKSVKMPGRVFTAYEIAMDYSVSPNTARTYLKELVKFDILKTSKDGRTVNYIAPANLLDLLNR
jgi:Fic family protein